MDVRIDITSETHEYQIRYLRKHLSKFNRLPGVYVFYDKNTTVLYVGKSKNLKQRLLQHIGGNSNVNLSDAVVCRIHVTLSETHADLLETHLINTLMPIFNIDKANYREFTEYASISLQDTLLEIKELNEQIYELVDDITRIDKDGLWWDDEDGEYLLGEHLYSINRLKELQSELSKLRRRAAIYKRRGGMGLSDVTAEEMKDNEKRRKAGAYLAMRRRCA